MKTSESIKEIAAALAKARRSFKPVFKDKVANVKSDKGSYSFAYADLSSCIEAVTEGLSENGIAVVQGTSTGTDGVTVETRLIHSSGEWIESAITMRVDGNRPQNIGSAITYARRYGLSAMVGISSEEDDDANAAQGNHREVKSRGSAEAAAKVRAAAAKPANAKPVPRDSLERKADLFARMKDLGIPGAKMAEQLGEWIGHVVDKGTVFTSDDWSRADTAIEQAKVAAETIAHAQANVAQAMGT